MTLMECQQCGGKVSSEAEVCPDCGSIPFPVECWECGEEVESEEDTCPSCGAPDPAGGRTASSARRRLKPYYREQFRKFDEKDGNFRPTWNWPAFFFGPFWYFYRGMWAKAIILFILAVVSGGVMWLFAVGWGAIVGNYDYYLLVKEDAQLYPAG